MYRVKSVCVSVVVSRLFALVVAVLFFPALLYHLYVFSLECNQSIARNGDRQNEKGAGRERKQHEKSEK